MAKQKSDASVEETPQTDNTTAASQLAQALVEAINIAKPKEKKNPFNRKEGSPWTPADGKPKLKLRRKMLQHGYIIDPDFNSNECIELLNKVEPGSYLNGWVKINRRKDQAIDIDYPVRTASQRMRLSSEFRIHSFEDLLKRCIDEAEQQKKAKAALEN